MAPEMTPQGGGRPHAALPMYDWPETATAWDGLWSAVRDELAAAGIDAEAELRRRDDQHHGWLAPDLILGQSCGWPYMVMLRGKVAPIARFDFGLATKRPGDYYSVFITHPDLAVEAKRPGDLAPLLSRPNTVVAINSTLSQSGYRVLGECAASPITVPQNRALTTGSHRQSIRAVADGRAHVAAIDAASWQFARDHEPAAAGVRVVARSADAPGLPLIVANGLKRHRDTVYRALEKAVAGLPQATRERLRLRGVVAAADEDYHVLEGPPYGNLRIA